MTIFLARQPIFDRKRAIRAYEVFYRSGFTNHYTGVDDDVASAKVLIDTFQNIGLELLTGGKPAFVNFSATLLEKRVATLFPNKYLVIEVLESVIGVAGLAERCRELKEAGYTIVLDDFVYSPGIEPFLEVADLVKIDFRATDGRQLDEMIKFLQLRRLPLLAEKVETWEQYEQARRLDFSLFQGYFFSRPELISATRLTPLQLNCLELILKLNEPAWEFQELAEIVSRDLSLTYSLLRLVNSVAFARRQPARTVKDALVILGEREIKKWVTLIALQRLSVVRPDAVVAHSLLRGRFAELLAAKTSWREHKDTLFLAGLFSMLDVLLQRPLPEILAEIKVPEAIQELLVDGTGPFRDFWQAVLTYELGEWDGVEEQAAQLEVAPAVFFNSYVEALEWAPASL